MKFIEVTEDEFDNYEKVYRKGNFYQTVEWALVKKRNNWCANYFIIKDGDKLVGITLLLSKKLIFNNYLYYAPRGFVTDYNNKEYVEFFSNSLKEYVKNKRGCLLKIDPLVSYHHLDNDGKKIDEYQNDEIISLLESLGYKHHGFTKGYTNEFQFRWSYVLDIKNKTIDELVSQMHTRTKRSIKKFQKYPLVSKFNNVEDFYDIMEHTCKRQKQNNRSIEYFKSLSDTLGNNLEIIVIYMDKKKYLDDYNDKDSMYESIIRDNRDYIPLATGLFIMHDNVVNYVYGGVYQKYMKSCSQYRVQYDMIKYAIKNNYQIYDFGGITGDFDENSHAYGVYGFKRGFSGYVTEYIGEFDLIVNKFIYLIYRIFYFLYNKIRK